MARVTRVVSGDGNELGFSFYCAGCCGYHMFYSRPWQTWNRAKNALNEAFDGPVWSFNGNMEAPTFNPSLLIYEVKRDDGVVTQPRCHSFVRAGRIQFLSDCGHLLANQTVDLLDVDKTPF